MFSNFRKAFLIAAIVALPSLAHAGEPFDAKGFQASQAAGKSILVDVTAPWCPTCKQQRPIVREIEKEHPDLVVYGGSLKTPAYRSDTTTRLRHGRPFVCLPGLLKECGRGLMCR
jgi:thiol-disulfide isomerase/thioredoxin